MGIGQFSSPFSLSINHYVNYVTTLLHNDFYYVSDAIGAT